MKIKTLIAVKASYLIDVEIADDFIKASVQIVEEVDNL